MKLAQFLTDQGTLITQLLPGRITAEVAAKVLGFHPSDIALLVRSKLLKPLGSPSQNSVKYFATTDILTCAADRDWLHRATKAVTQNHSARRGVGRGKCGDGGPFETTAHRQ